MSRVKAADMLTFGDINRPRQLPVSGTKNLRDIGGYPTTDGRTVRWGVLYRSDALNKLKDDGLHTLKTMGISLVVDFRAEHEVEREPDKLPDGARLLNLHMEDSSTKVWHEARSEMTKNMKTMDPAKFMIKTNIELATKFTPVYRKFFNELVNANGRPVLFHCAAGKDRTGFAAAVILRVLGVPHNVAMQDYLLTNKYLLSAYKWEISLARILKGKKFAEGITGFMRADERYISAAFNRLEQDHGSFENYIWNGLGLSESKIATLKKYYLE